MKKTVMSICLLMATGAICAEEGFIDKSKAAVEHGAEVTADAVKRGAHAAGRGIERGAEAAVQGVKVGVTAAGHGIKRGTDATMRAAHKIKDKVRSD